MNENNIDENSEEIREQLQSLSIEDTLSSIASTLGQENISTSHSIADLSAQCLVEYDQNYNYSRWADQEEVATRLKYAPYQKALREISNLTIKPSNLLIILLILVFEFTNAADFQFRNNRERLRFFERSYKYYVLIRVLQIITYLVVKKFSKQYEKQLKRIFRIINLAESIFYNFFITKNFSLERQKLPFKDTISSQCTMNLLFALLSASYLPDSQQLNDSWLDILGLQVSPLLCNLPVFVNALTTKSESSCFLVMNVCGILLFVFGCFLWFTTKIENISEEELFQTKQKFNQKIFVIFQYYPIQVAHDVGAFLVSCGIYCQASSFSALIYGFVAVCIQLGCFSYRVAKHKQNENNFLAVNS